MTRILVIEDEPVFQTLMKSALKKAGYEVMTASDGEEGMRLFTEQPYDMVITDITMPGMDGNAVARSIRSSGKGDVPIIAMSGYDDKADTELFNVSVQKPFNLQSFREVIKSIEGGPKIVQNEKADEKRHA